MDNSRELIDFSVDNKFYDSLGEGNDLMKGEIFSLFTPITHLYRLYKIISLIVNKDEAPIIKDLDAVGLDSLYARYLFADFKKEIPAYRFIHAIMLNDISKVKDVLDEKIVNLKSPLRNTALFRFASEKLDMDGLTYLNIAAALGRKEICHCLIEKGINTGTMIILSGIKSYSIPLSVNECLIMNASFQWYKSERKKKLQKKEVEELVDLITLASKRNPSIVNSDHLLNVGIRVQWYWSQLNIIVENVTLLKKLIPLNALAMEEILNIK